METENSQELIRRVKRDGVELVEYGIHILLDYYFVIEDDAFYYCD